MSQVKNPTRNRRNRRKILKSMIKTLKLKKNKPGSATKSPVRSPKKENLNVNNIHFSISPSSGH